MERWGKKLVQIDLENRIRPLAYYRTGSESLRISIFFMKAPFSPKKANLRFFCVLNSPPGRVTITLNVRCSQTIQAVIVCG